MRKVLGNPTLVHVFLCLHLTTLSTNNILLVLLIFPSPFVSCKLFVFNALSWVAYFEVKTQMYSRCSMFFAENCRSFFIFSTFLKPFLSKDYLSACHALFFTGVCFLPVSQSRGEWIQCFWGNSLQWDE